MNESIIDADPKWMESATDDELREFMLNYLDKMDDKSPRYKVLMAAFDRECNRRSGECYDTINNGEWI